MARRKMIPVSPDDGRARGESHGRAVLNWDKVREIRRRFNGKLASQDELARDYGVGRTTIYRIIINEIWNDPEYIRLRHR